MKMLLTLIIIVLILLTLTSCTKHHDYVYSLDKKQCITIISDRDIRYIIAGKHSSIPDTNYIKLYRRIRSEGDEIVGCWRTEEYEWKLINDGATIVENKLDTVKFKFSNKFPNDDRGIPTTHGFKKNECFAFGFEYNELHKYKRGVIIE